MSDQVLNILKYFLLALVWLFFLRILRVVWVEIRNAEDATAAPPGDISERAGVIPAARPGARGRRSRGAAEPSTQGAPTAAAPSPGIRPSRLRVVEPEDLAGHSFPLGGSGDVVLGRTTAVDVPLPGDSFVSSRHARVYARGREVWVEDLGSTNGTFVNSARISSPTVLRAGDRLQVGRTVLEVQA